jgi:hypothetical protein
MYITISFAQGRASLSCKIFFQRYVTPLEVSEFIGEYFLKKVGKEAIKLESGWVNDGIGR